jgi:hypothetical protein
MSEPSNIELDRQVVEQDEKAAISDQMVQAMLALLQKEKRKIADQLRDIAQRAHLFHDRDGGCYADIAVNGHRETWPIRSKGFRRWLTQEFIKETDTAPNSNAMQIALDAIEAKAHFDSEECPVNVRTAEYQGKLYLDLVNDTWQVVEIDADGWRIINDPPVRFRRARGMQSLPEPVQGGEINLLRHFLNVKREEDFVLAVCWTLAALRSRGPYPIIVPLGEQGSGKSTFSRILRALVDPSKALLRTQPRDERDVAITANNSWVIATDNVSSLPAWLSDAYCRLSTGGGFATRTLYTDQDETIFDSMRPIILNGIEEFVTRPDLADRAMLLTLEAIPENRRKSEGKLWSDFAAAHPLILGALLDAMVHGIQNLPGIKLAQFPRMADFAVWATACETAIWKSGTFEAAYTENRDDAVISVVEADAVATTVVAFMATRERWEGTAAELLSELAAVAGEQTVRTKDWPTSHRGLSGRLRRASTSLRKIGVDLEYWRVPHARTRMIAITKEEKVAKEPSPPSRPSPPKTNHSRTKDFDGSSTGTQNPQASPTVPHTVPTKSLNHRVGTDGDGGTAKIPPQSSEAIRRCQQCNGAPDGTEHIHEVSGRQVWLHPECRPFWPEGDGWGLRRT